MHERLHDLGGYRHSSGNPAARLIPPDAFERHRDFIDIVRGIVPERQK